VRWTVRRRRAMFSAREKNRAVKIPARQEV